MSKRKIPCKFCQGEVLSEQNGRTSSSQALFPRMQNLLVAISDLLAIVTGGPKTVPKKDAIGGKCEACGDTGELEDYTDTTEEDKAAADILSSNQETILQNEIKRGNGLGGNTLHRTAGNRFDMVGLTFNNAQSYTLHENKAVVAGAGEVHQEGRAAVTVGVKTNGITSNNVPSNGGGDYRILAANRFEVGAGAQGIWINTPGPVTMAGSIVRLAGAEVSVGSREGPLLLQGKHTQIGGDTITMTPQGEKGHVHIQGTVSATGNVQAGGAYFDNLFFATATCPSKQEPTKVSSQTDLLAGPALWGYAASGPQGSGRLTKVSLENFLKWIVDSTTDINLSKTLGALNPRNALKNSDNGIALFYSILPIESKITGICVGLFGAGIVYNYPHSHPLPDTPHTHDVTVPAINHEGNSSADLVREKYKAGGGNTRIPVSSEGGAGNIFNKLLAAIGAVIQSIFGKSRPYEDAL